MNFHDLRIIVNQIKKNIDCPRCKSKFTDEDLELVGGLGDELTFFYASCMECESEAMISVNLQIGTQEAPLPEISRLGSAPRGGKVSANEVLDMQNFLKNFDGDFTKVFKAPKRKS